MPAEYDAIAEEYRESKLLPFRVQVEQPTLRALLGDVRGRSVLDLACGEGIYSRMVRQLGAARVHGIDLSPEMVRLAEQTEAQAPIGCTYAVGDATAAPPSGAERFDLVMGVYLLNYARSADELRAMARTIAGYLAPGGRFVGINDNPRNAVERYGPLPEYGYTREVALPRAEGMRIHYTMRTPDGSSFEFDNYWLAPATHDQVFAEVGLARFRWVDCIARAGPDGSVAPLWRAFLRDCPITGLEARA
jgi:SAM-dependent methyltransferase